MIIKPLLTVLIGVRMTPMTVPRGSGFRARTRTCWSTPGTGLEELRYIWRHRLETSKFFGSFWGILDFYGFRFWMQ